jgi:hypothetical protein
MSERRPPGKRAETGKWPGRRFPRVGALILGAVAIGSCSEGVSEPPPPARADVQLASLELFPGNLLVGETAVMEAAVANLGDGPSGPVSWELTAGGALVASGQLSGIAPGETDRIGPHPIGPFELGSHTVVLQIETAAGGEPGQLVRQRRFNVFEPGYSIDLRIIGELTPNQEAAFQAARERWERVIVGSLEPTRVTLAANECWDGDPAGHPPVDEVVDDLLIIAIVGDFGNPLTQPDAFLALAGPCVLREDNYPAAMGLIVFNLYAMQHFEGVGHLADVIAHEIGHILGINPEVWEPKELLVGGGGPDPRFVGSHAKRAFRDVTMHPLSGAVPVENEGGPGTRDAHWRWRDFTDPRSSELMTAIFRDDNPISAVTIGALDDIGYAVDTGRAEQYVLSSATGLASTGPTLDIGDDRLPGPLRVVSPDGRTRVVLERR